MFEHVGCKNHRTFFESVRAALRPGRVAPGGRPVDRPLHLPERLRALPRAWPRFRERHGDRFFRMFRYSMLSCAGAFRARQMQLFQVVLSPDGVPGGYEAVR